MVYTKVSITSKAVFVLGQTSLGCDTVTSQQEKTQHQTLGPCNSWTTLISFSSSTPSQLTLKYRTIKST